jgi:uncharacterized protein
VSTIASITRHPLKGFSPEPMQHVTLVAGDVFPLDRLYAVENGPSGYDPAAPTFIPKTRFTVLAGIAKVAAVRTRFDDNTGLFSAEAPGMAPFTAVFDSVDGRAAFEDWLTTFLGADARGPLKIVKGTGGHRFTDHPLGHVSLINLASVRALERETGWALDALRFRANFYVEGLPAWAETHWAPGALLRIGRAETQVLKPIVRCAATHVDPSTATRDRDVCAALYEHTGKMELGVYLTVTCGGLVSLGDPLSEIS